MTAPRLEIDLEKVFQNATTLVERLDERGISVTGITKGMLGAPELANVMVQAGVIGLGDSRIENIEAMRRAGISAPMTLIRSPMLSQSRRVVATADVSLNTEIDVIRSLSLEAQNAHVIHDVVLMIELGDLREGIMPNDLDSIVRQTLRCLNIRFTGIGANLACRSGVSPDDRNMTELSALASSLEAAFDITVEVVSGGNSANLLWAFAGGHSGRINNLRLGESILLGCEPLHRQPIDGLHTDACAIIAEVIESKVKPAQPWGKVAQAAFSESVQAQTSGTDVCESISQAILATGHQDTDPTGLQMDPGVRLLGASSDHLIVETVQDVARSGSELTMRPNYSDLVRAMTSPFVAKVWKPRRTGVPRPVRHGTE
jgi:predicted amino acid racemase